MIENVGGIYTDLATANVQTGVFPGLVSLELCDRDLAKGHMHPKDARDLASYLMLAAEKAEKVPCACPDGCYIGKRDHEGHSACARPGDDASIPCRQ